MIPVVLSLGVASMLVHAAAGVRWILRRYLSAENKAKASLMARNLRGAVRAWEKYGESRSFSSGRLVVAILPPDLSENIKMCVIGCG